MRAPRNRPGSWPRSWLSPKIVLGASPIHGTGEFARADISPGERLKILGGRVMTDHELAAYAAGRDRYDALAIGEGLHLVLAPGDPAAQGNHSCDANTGMADEVTVVARRAIERGEEVTVDYALHTVDDRWTMACACGASACRGVVTGADWRRPDVQARYPGGFSPFIARRIAGGAGR